MVSMANRRKIKRLVYAAVMLIGAGLLLAALWLLSQTAQNSEQFSRLQNWIFAINEFGACRADFKTTRAFLGRGGDCESHKQQRQRGWR